MSELTPETLAEWRRDAEHWRDALPTKTDKLQGERILALLDALDEAERERDEAREQDRQGDYANEANLDYISELEKRLTEAREALARVEALVEKWRYKGEFGWGAWQEGHGPDQEGYVLDNAAADLRAALRGPSDTEGQA